MLSQKVRAPEADAPKGVEVAALKTEEEFLTLEQEWSTLHSAAGGTIFQTFEWLWKWWQVYRKPANSLHIVTVRIEGRLAAILPLYLDRIGILGITLNRLRMLGVYETYGEYTILTDHTEIHRCARALAAELAGYLRRPDIDLVSFFRFPPGSEAMGALMKELRNQGLTGRFIPKVIQRVMMELPASWDAYLANLTANEREGIKRKARALQKNGAEIEVVVSADPEAFDDYARLHTQSWHPRGLKGYFSSPRFKDFLCGVTMTMMARGHARLYFLKKDGKRFAAVHAFFMHNQCCFYLSGLDRNHELVNLSPGKVLLARVIRDAIEEGYAIFDFQGGDEEYKFRLGGKPTTFAKALFWVNDIRSIKIMSFLGVQALHEGFRWHVNERLLPYLRSIRLRPRRERSAVS